MSQSRIDLLAAAVVESINAEEFSQEATAAMAYHPIVGLPNLAAIRVWVIPASRETAIATRSEDDDTLAVFVAVRQKIDTASTAAVAALNYYAEQIYEHLRRNHMTVSGTAYKWNASEFVEGSDAGYAPGHLEQPRVYTSVMKITYQGVV